jgi:hypothetical protein
MLLEARQLVGTTPPFFSVKVVARPPGNLSKVLPSCCRFGDNVLEGSRANGIPVVARKSKSKFDPEAFLAKADGGLTVSNYVKGQVIS